MTEAKKHIKVADKMIYDTEIMYARAMVLQNSSREYDADNLLIYELSPYPLSMFENDGEIRIAKTKSTLKNSLKVEIFTRNTGAEATFLDGCAVLWTVQWPTNGSVQDYVNNFRQIIQFHLNTSTTYLLFDRYIEGSIKDCTRMYHEQNLSRVYVLKPSTKLPT